ncbi:MAG: type I methionyl aminopeptidase [Candidatus Woesebacteria bacterium]|jgi:methionyl aminopeptidase
MFTRVKTPTEIESMRTSGKMLACILQLIDKTVVPGMTGKDVSELVVKELKAFGAKASFLGYAGFPAVICISVNDEVVHGIPSAAQFKEGDVVGFDFGVTYNEMITDSAFTLIVGGKDTQNSDVIRLVEKTEQSLYAGLDKVKNGVRVGDIASAIQRVLDREKLGIVRELVGHGVGHEVHEDPNIPNYGTAGTGSVLKTGMTVAIEPMATLGKHQITVDEDGWTIRTKDNSISAHFEHTVLIADKGCEILTAWQ